MNTNEVITSLDIGSTCVRAVVCEREADGLKIIGVGQRPSTGLRKALLSTYKLLFAQYRRQ